MQRYESYKQSGANWIGEVSKEWGTARLKFVFKHEKAKLPRKISSSPSGHPYLSMAYLRGKSSEQYVLDKDAKVVDAGEILLLWDGANAGEFILSRAGVVSSTLAHVKVVPGIDKQFGWYYLKFLERQLRQETVGMGIPHVSGTSLNNLLCCIPLLDEQIRIGRYLDQKAKETDATIAHKVNLIKLLSEQQDILISQAVTRGLNLKVPMCDSGVAWIGQVPVHWKQLANRALFRERIEPGQADLPILSVSIHTAVSDEEQDGTENVRAKVRIEDKTSYKRVRPGDVTYNMMRAWQGAIGVVRVDGLVSPAYVVAAPLATINGTYFEYLYRTHGFIREMDRYSKGITDFRKRLYWDEFKQLVSLLPPLDEQIQIATYAEQVINKTLVLTEKIRVQIDALNEFRASLIENLVTGKIRA